ncbi:MAG TPA: Rieske 2Fe-2S domain-containing protein [Acetobacteraceae bacterium]|nr:Rieske 2Fe-2S domain-containing protein [Acetobacteraceae bacterium]
MTWLTDRLTKLMTDRDQSVPALARQLGIERSRLSNILAGSALPNENLLRRLAQSFDEAPDEWVAQARRAEPDAPTRDVPAGFVRIASLSEIPDGVMKIVFNDLVVVANTAGRLHAFGNVCPHAAGPIGEGWLEGCVVECPWHNGQWDITTGKALTELATADIPVFEVRVVGDAIEVRLTPSVLAQKSPGGGETQAP